jgi:hypothetical protein
MSLLKYTLRFRENGKNLLQTVNVYWSLKLKDEVNSKPTLEYLNVDDVMIGKTHNIWNSGGAEPYAVMVGPNVYKVTSQFVDKWCTDFL